MKSSLDFERVTSKKSVLRLAFPLLTIAVGVVFIVTKEGVYEAVVAEGAIVVFVGVLMCALGVWGLVRTIQEDRSKPEPNQPPLPTPGVVMPAAKAPVGPPPGAAGR